MHRSLLCWGAAMAVLPSLDTVMRPFAAYTCPQPGASACAACSTGSDNDCGVGVTPWDADPGAGVGSPGSWLQRAERSVEEAEAAASAAAGHSSGPVGQGSEGEDTGGAAPTEPTPEHWQWAAEQLKMPLEQVRGSMPERLPLNPSPSALGLAAVRALTRRPQAPAYCSPQPL